MFIYNLCIKKIAADFSPSVTPPITCQISLYVATKVINKNDCLLTDTLKLKAEIDNKEHEFIDSFDPRDLGDVHRGVLQPPDNIVCSSPSNEAHSTWHHGVIELNVTASGIFF